MQNIVEMRSGSQKEGAGQESPRDVKCCIFCSGHLGALKAEKQSSESQVIRLLIFIVTTENNVS